MYEPGKTYLYSQRVEVTFLKTEGNYLIFTSGSTIFKISKYNTQNIRKPFKFIRL